MDNPVFNVKGQYQESLKDALVLAFSVLDRRKADGYRLDRKKGLVLYWTVSSSKKHEVIPFPKPLDAHEVFEKVIEFFEGEFVKEITLQEWDDEADDMDVEDETGWRVYTERWGRIDEDSYAFLAITPSFCWTGK